MIRKHMFGVVMAACLAMVLMASPAKAALWTINNTVAHSATYNDATGSFTDWTAGGIDHAFDLSFWYRVGSAGPEAKLVLGAVQPVGDTLVLSYIGSTFDVSITASLAPGVAVGGSLLNMEPTVINKGTGPLSFHLFEYVDLDLTATPGDDTVRRTLTNRVTQTDNSTIGVETVVAPSEFLAGAGVGGAGGVLGALTDGDADNFNDAVGTSASGDVAFVFQWDINLAPANQPGSDYTTSNEHRLASNPIPEPVTASLCVFGLLGLAVGVSRRRLA